MKTTRCKKFRPRPTPQTVLLDYIRLRLRLRGSPCSRNHKGSLCEQRADGLVTLPAYIHARIWMPKSENISGHVHTQTGLREYYQKIWGEKLGEKVGGICCAISRVETRGENSCNKNHLFVHQLVHHTVVQRFHFISPNFPRIFHHMFHHAFTQSCSQRFLTVGVLHTYSPDVCWCSSYPTNFVAIQKRPGKCQKGHVQSSCSSQKKRNKVRNPTVATRGRPDHPGGRKLRRRGQNQTSNTSPKIHSATGPP